MPAPVTPPPAQPDDDTVGRLLLAVLRLARRLRQEAPDGITPSQLSALSIVAAVGPLTIGELGSRENIATPTISRIVTALEASGRVERIADPSDRRVTRLRATPKAQRELAQVRAERNNYLAERLTSLADDERDTLVAALPALERLVAGSDR